jgi:putative transposase
LGSCWRRPKFPRTHRQSLAGKTRVKFPIFGYHFGEAKRDVLTVVNFSRAQWTQIFSENPLRRLNARINRSTSVVSIFSSDVSITNLLGAMMWKQNDERGLKRRNIQLAGQQTHSDTVPKRVAKICQSP